MKIESNMSPGGIDQTSSEVPKVTSVQWKLKTYSPQWNHYGSCYFSSELVCRVGALRDSFVELREVSRKKAKLRTYEVVGSNPVVYVRRRISAKGLHFFVEISEPKRTPTTVKQTTAATALSLRQGARKTLKAIAWLARQAARFCAAPIYLPVFLLLQLCLYFNLTQVATKIKVAEDILYTFISKFCREDTARSVDIDEEYVHTHWPELLAQRARENAERMEREAQGHRAKQARQTTARAQTSAESKTRYRDEWESYKAKPASAALLEHEARRKELLARRSAHLRSPDLMHKMMQEAEHRAREAREKEAREKEARKREEEARTNTGIKTPDSQQGPYAPMLADTRKVASLLAQLAEAKKTSVAEAVSVVGRQATTANAALVISLTNRVLGLQRELQKLLPLRVAMQNKQGLAIVVALQQMLRLLLALPQDSADIIAAARKSYRTLALAVSSDKMYLEAGPKLTAAQKSYVDDLLRLLNLANELIVTD